MCYLVSSCDNMGDHQTHRKRHSTLTSGLYPFFSSSATACMTTYLIRLYVKIVTSVPSRTSCTHKQQQTRQSQLLTLYWVRQGARQCELPVLTESNQECGVLLHASSFMRARFPYTSRERHSVAGSTDQVFCMLTDTVCHICTI